MFVVVAVEVPLNKAVLVAGNIAICGLAFAPCDEIDIMPVAVTLDVAVPPREKDVLWAVEPVLTLATSAIS